jgi:hypothetical protein
MAICDCASVDKQIVLLALNMRFIFQLRPLNNLQVIETADNKNETAKQDELPGSKAPQGRAWPSVMTS